MNFEQILDFLSNIEWFASVGRMQVESDNTIALPNLYAWSSDEMGVSDYDEIAEAMDWLPCTHDQEDPFYSYSLQKQAADCNKKVEISKLSMEAHRLLLVNLREIEGDKRFVAGGHDMSLPAKGAALYASRMFIFEMLLNGEKGPWERIIKIYDQGYWPCGLIGKSIIVY